MSKIRLPVNWVPDEIFLFSLQTIGSHIMEGELGFLPPLLSSLIPSGISTLMTLSNSNYLRKVHLLIPSHWRIGFLHRDGWVGRYKHALHNKTPA